MRNWRLQAILGAAIGLLILSAPIALGSEKPRTPTSSFDANHLHTVHQYGHVKIVCDEAEQHCWCTEPVRRMLFFGTSTPSAKPNRVHPQFRCITPQELGVAASVPPHHRTWHRLWLW